MKQKITTMKTKNIIFSAEFIDKKLNKKAFKATFTLSKHQYGKKLELIIPEYWEQITDWEVNTIETI